MTEQLALANLKVSDLCKRYGSASALDQVNLDIVSGEFLTLLGPSGSGKTTLLNAIAGFVQPDSGSVWLNGRDITEWPAEARGFGMVFQGYALFPHLTVAENIAFPLHIRKTQPAQRARRVDAMLELVGLTSHRDKRPQQLSGGQQQRVALARALVYAPPLLLLDEPFSALDKNLKSQLHEEIRRIHREVQTTFVFVSHDQSEALALSDRVAVFESGRLHQVASPKVLYEQPANRFCAQFLGELNLFPLEQFERRDGRVTGRFEGRVLSIQSPDAHLVAPCIGVRPEHCSLEREPGTTGSAVAIQIESASYEGALTKLILRSRGGQRFTHKIASSTGVSVEPGLELWLCWPEDKAFLI
jgi:putative spermidine/putrescine transport system ATP-binding protein